MNVAQMVLVEYILKKTYTNSIRARNCTELAALSTHRGT